MPSDEDRSLLEGIEGNEERLAAESRLLASTDNSARPEDGPQPKDVRG